MKKALFLVFLSLSFPFCKRGVCVADGVFPSPAGLSAAQTYREGEVLVKFRKGIGLADARGIVSAYGVKVPREFPALSRRTGQAFFHLRSGSLTTRQLLHCFQQDSRVEKVSPNYLRKITATFPYDPSFDQLWGLDNTGQKVNGISGTSDADIDAAIAWDFTRGDTSVVIAVIDTGVDYTHEDLAANMWNSEEIADNDIDDDGNGYVDDLYGINAITEAANPGDPMDDHGHGTHVSGTIAAVGNNGVGITGVNWSARIMAVKFLDAEGSGTDADAITGINYVVSMKTEYNVNIVAINASWGGGGYDALLEDAIEAAGDAGIIFVAAAGNDGSDNDATPAYPASYSLPNIISVAASDQDDGLAWFSNYGLKSVDLAAPGVNIYSTLPGGATDSPNNPFFDRMESGTAKWEHGGTQDSWALTDSSYHSESHCWADSPGGDYLNNTSSYLSIKENLNLSALAGQDVRLRFWADLELEEDIDILYVELSRDGGSNFDYVVGSLTGSAPLWSLYSYSVPEAYKTAAFKFRFHLITDGNNTYDGVYLDDVVVDTGLGGASSNYYDYYDGTSMAAPHVSGAVALSAAGFPQESLSQRINRVSAGCDRLTALEGKSVTGGRLNVGNSITNTFAITGTITKDEAGSPPLPDVLVSLVDLTLNDTVLTDTTGAAGTYTLYAQGSQDGREYRIVPKLKNWRFTPTYQEVTVTDADIAGNDFTVQEAYSTISGRVTQGTTSTGLADVLLTLSGTGFLATISTDANGDYQFQNVLAGDYTLTPAITGWDLQPTSISYAGLESDMPDQNFTAYLQITFTTEPSGTPNPVTAGSPVRCSVTAYNSTDSPFTYSWEADDGYFEDTGVDTSGLQNPVWIAEVAVSPLTEYEVQITVTASCTNAISKTTYYSQVVTPSQSVESGEGGCFIATAAFGTPLAKEVGILRNFRDRFLLKSKWGRAFVRFYNQYSPPVAEFIRPRPALCGLVRGFLRPVIWLAHALPCNR
ncbi:MAG: S8 family serine peptidase [Candidatus Omnitrophota bacterium]